MGNPSTSDSLSTLPVPSPNQTPTKPLPQPQNVHWKLLSRQFMGFRADLLRAACAGYFSSDTPKRVQVQEKSATLTGTILHRKPRSSPSAGQTVLTPQVFFLVLLFFTGNSFRRFLTAVSVQQECGFFLKWSTSARGAANAPLATQVWPYWGGSWVHRCNHPASSSPRPTPCTLCCPCTTAAPFLLFTQAVPGEEH